jgi:hypothetical protein
VDVAVLTLPLVVDLVTFNVRWFSPVPLLSVARAQNPDDGVPPSVSSQWFHGLGGSVDANWYS